MQMLLRLCGNRYVRTAFILALSVLAAVSVIQGAKNALMFSQDFQWDAAKALCLRADPYELSLQPEKVRDIPELEQFYAFFTDRGLKQQMEANQFPSLLVLLAPMTLFPAGAARSVWLILNLLFTAGILFLLRKTFFRDTDTYKYAVIALLMLAGTPYRNQLGVGQHTLFAFFFFMLAVYLDMHDDIRPVWLNNTLIALCLFVSYFKYTLTAPLALYFLYRRRYREFAASVAAHAVLTAGCAAWLGKSFLYMIKAPLAVASALTAEGGIDLGVLLSGWSFAAAFVIAVILTVMAFRLPPQKDGYLFSLLILWSLVLTYHRTYDFFVISSVSMMFFATVEVFGKKRQIYAAWYWILTILIYFALRIFNENTFSKIVTGSLYYAFTLAVTYYGVKMCVNKRQGMNDNG